jgi:hypothetical protein
MRRLALIIILFLSSCVYSEEKPGIKLGVLNRREIILGGVQYEHLSPPSDFESVQVKHLFGSQLIYLFRERISNDGQIQNKRQRLVVYDFLNKSQMDSVEFVLSSPNSHNLEYIEATSGGLYFGSLLDIYFWDQGKGEISSVWSREKDPFWLEFADQGGRLPSLYDVEEIEGQLYVLLAGEFEINEEGLVNTMFVGKLHPEGFQLLHEYKTTGPATRNLHGFKESLFYRVNNELFRYKISSEELVPVHTFLEDTVRTIWEDEGFLTLYQQGNDTFVKYGLGNLLQSVETLTRSTGNNSLSSEYFFF